MCVIFITSTDSRTCIIFFSEDVYLIYELCSYDKYIKDEESFWCDLLDDEQRLVLEYGQDIEVRTCCVVIC